MSQKLNAVLPVQSLHQRRSVRLNGYFGAGIPGLYVPVAATGLVDSAGNSWGAGNARAVGTYTFRPADNSNIWPATARAVQLFVFSQWAAANNASIVSTRRAAGGINEGQVRALVAGVGYSTNLIQALDGSGYFYVNLATANSTSSVIRVLGYYT